MLKLHLGFEMHSLSIFPPPQPTSHELDIVSVVHEVRIVFLNSLALRAVLGALMARSHSLLCIIS